MRGRSAAAASASSREPTAVSPASLMPLMMPSRAPDRAVAAEVVAAEIAAAGRPRSRRRAASRCRSRRRARGRLARRARPPQASRAGRGSSPRRSPLALSCTTMRATVVIPTFNGPAARGGARRARTPDGRRMTSSSSTTARPTGRPSSSAERFPHAHRPAAGEHRLRPRRQPWAGARRDGRRRADQQRRGLRAGLSRAAAGAAPRRERRHGRGRSPPARPAGTRRLRGIELDTTLRSWDAAVEPPPRRSSPAPRSRSGPCGGAAAFRTDDPARGRRLRRDVLRLLGGRRPRASAAARRAPLRSRDECSRAAQARADARRRIAGSTAPRGLRPRLRARALSRRAAQPRDAREDRSARLAGAPRAPARSPRARPATRTPARHACRARRPALRAPFELATVSFGEALGASGRSASAARERLAADAFRPEHLRRGQGSGARARDHW